MAVLVHLTRKNSKQAQQHTIIVSLVEITSLVKFALRPCNYTFIHRAHSTVSAIVVVNTCVRSQKQRMFLPLGSDAAWRSDNVLPGKCCHNRFHTAITDQRLWSTFNRVLECRRCRHPSLRIKSHQTRPINELVVYGSISKSTISTTCR